jgi:hypothetical protein
MLEGDRLGAGGLLGVGRLISITLALARLSITKPAHLAAFPYRIHTFAWRCLRQFFIRTIRICR